jgi:hypothetical protein
VAPAALFSMEAVLLIVFEVKIATTAIFAASRCHTLYGHLFQIQMLR